MIIPWSHNLLANQIKTSWQKTQLIRSSLTSFLQKQNDNSVDPHYLKSLDDFGEQKSQNLALLLQNKNQKQSGRIFLIGTSYLAKDQFLKMSQGNAVFIQNLIEYSSWGDSLIGIRSRGKTSRPLKIKTEKQKLKLKIMHFLLPSFLLLVVTFVFQFYNRKSYQNKIKKWNLEK